MLDHSTNSSNDSKEVKPKKLKYPKKKELIHYLIKINEAEEYKNVILI